MKTHGDWYSQVYEKTMGVKAREIPKPTIDHDAENKLMSEKQEKLYWKKMYNSIKDRN